MRMGLSLMKLPMALNAGAGLGMAKEESVKIESRTRNVICIVGRGQIDSGGDTLASEGNHHQCMIAELFLVLIITTSEDCSSIT